MDPDGNRFIIDDAIGAVVGAAVGAYTAYKMGYDLTDWETYALVGGGAAIGVASVYTAGAAAGAAGGGFAGAIAGGVAAGAVGSAANYTLTSGVGSSFDNFSGSGLWQAAWTGAAAGVIGGGVGGGLGHFGVNGAVTSFSAGFAGGASGAYLNGARGWDVVKAGALSGGIGLASYGAKVGVDCHPRSGQIMKSLKLTKDGKALTWQLNDGVSQWISDGLTNDQKNGLPMKYRMILS